MSGDETLDSSIDEIDDYITRINKILNNSNKTSNTSIHMNSGTEKLVKSADKTIARINNILTSSNKININNSSEPKPGQSATNDMNISASKPGKSANKTNKQTKKQKDSLLLNYKSLEQLESLCKRAVILHTQGVYVRPPQNHNCDNKKKRKRVGGKKKDRGENAQMPKKTFGKGNVGVSCEAYGIKRCTCCAPRNDEDILFMQSLHSPEFKVPKLLPKSPDYLDYVDLTDPYDIKPSSSKKWDDSVIFISDSIRNNSVVNPNKVIVLDDDSESETPITSKINNVRIEIKTEDKELTNSNLGVKNLIPTHTSEETIITDINSEVLDTVPNYADIENITDYIDLVTSDYDADAMRKYEEELTEAMIQSEIEALSAASKNTIKNVSTENRTQAVLNTDIKTEVSDTVANYANIENITDFINLVTSDYDTDAMLKSDELTEAMIQSEIEALSSATSENTTKSVSTENVTPLVLNKKILPKTDTVNNNVEVVASKAIASNSRQELTCPVCLENLFGHEVMSTICGHLFCVDCIKEVIKKNKECPNCRRKLNLKQIHPIYLG